jgi:tRNA 2-thiouridine synthesizing protein A
MPQEGKLLDASGMDCTRVILGLKKALAEIDSGQILKVVAADPIAPKALEGFARQTRHILLKQAQNSTAFIFLCKRHDLANVATYTKGGGSYCRPPGRWVVSTCTTMTVERKKR